MADARIGILTGWSRARPYPDENPRTHPLNGELPSPKGVALAILELCRKDDATIAEVARIAQTDPALASRLIRQANSAAHGGGRPVASVTEAIMRLGMGTVRNLALGFRWWTSTRTGPADSSTTRASGRIRC